MTGAATGSIRCCAAIRAACEGARVVCPDRNAADTEATVNQIRKHGGEVVVLIADMGLPVVPSAPCRRP